MKGITHIQKCRMYLYIYKTAKNPNVIALYFKDNRNHKLYRLALEKLMSKEYREVCHKDGVFKLTEKGLKKTDVFGNKYNFDNDMFRDLLKEDEEFAKEITKIKTTSNQKKLQQILVKVVEKGIEFFGNRKKADKYISCFGDDIIRQINEVKRENIIKEQLKNKSKDIFKEKLSDEEKKELDNHLDNCEK